MLIADRGFGTAGRDFLLEQRLPPGVGSIVTNPPFNLATKFLLHALDLDADVVALFCRVAFLESAERRSIFRAHPPSRVWIFSQRVRLQHGESAAYQDSMAFAWFVWRRLHPGTLLGWI